MCVASTVIAIASVVVAAGSAVVAEQQGAEAAAKQKEAARVQAAQNETNKAAAIRQQVREETVKRAQILQASQDTGTAASSGSLGAVSSLGSQTGNTIAESSSMFNTADSIGKLNQSAADAFGNAKLASSVGGVASNIFGGVMQTPAMQKNIYDFFNPKPAGTTADSQGFIGPPKP